MFYHYEGIWLLLPALLGEWGIYSAEILAWVGAAVLLIWGYYHRMHLIATGGQSL